MEDTGLGILIAGALMATALGASLLARRVRVPGLLLFLGIGMLAGSDSIGIVQFDNYALARDIGIIGLSLILFEGGLTAGIRELRPVLGTAISLGVIGTLVTAVISGLVASWLFGFTTLEGMLLGAAVATTDAAAVFAVLRGSPLRRAVARVLEGEAGFNDPVALLLVVGFIDWIQLPDYGLGDMTIQFGAQLAIGTAVGVGVGALAIQAIRGLRLETGGLYPVASLTAAALAYGLSDVAGGSGFLAVYVAGVTLGSAAIPARRTIGAFHQGLAWIAQLGMFLVLGLLVFPAQLPDVALEGTLMALVLAFVARPIAVGISTAFSQFDARERLVLGWAGLKGALPMVFATFPVVAGVEHSLEFFNIVFFAVVLSTLIQGTTVEPLARALGVTTPLRKETRPIFRSGTPVFTVRRWTDEDDDPAVPEEVLGVSVTEPLLERYDEAGALVVLADGRYAVTGALLVVGSAAQVQRQARKSLRSAPSEAERNWWQEVIGALAI